MFKRVHCSVNNYHDACSSPRLQSRGETCTSIHEQENYLTDSSALPESGKQKSWGYPKDSAPQHLSELGQEEDPCLSFCVPHICSQHLGTSWSNHDTPPTRPQAVILPVALPAHQASRHNETRLPSGPAGILAQCLHHSLRIPWPVNERAWLRPSYDLIAFEWVTFPSSQ